MGQRAMLPQEQTEVVLSAKNQPAAAQLRAPGSPSLKPGAPVDIAWRDSSRTGLRRPMRGDVLVVVIGVLCWHPGSAACWRDNRPSGGRGGESDHPPSNTM